MIGMVVWMNCTLNPFIRGDITLERYERHTLGDKTLTTYVTV